MNEETHVEWILAKRTEEQLQAHDFAADMRDVADDAEWDPDVETIVEVTDVEG